MLCIAESKSFKHLNYVPAYHFSLSKVYCLGLTPGSYFNLSDIQIYLVGFNRPPVKPSEKVGGKGFAPSNNIKQISCLKFRNPNRLKLRMILKSIFQEIIFVW